MSPEEMEQLRRLFEEIVEEKIPQSTRGPTSQDIADGLSSHIGRRFKRAVRVTKVAFWRRLAALVILLNILQFVREPLINWLPFPSQERSCQCWTTGDSSHQGCSNQSNKGILPSPGSRLDGSCPLDQDHPSGPGKTRPPAIEATKHTRGPTA